jgi:molybdopterin synthase sulfur carrier subunit
MTILIPPDLRVYAADSDSFIVEAATVSQVLSALTDAHPDLRPYLFTPDGKVATRVTLRLNDADIWTLPAKDETVTEDEDVLSIGNPKSAA